MMRYIGTTVITPTLYVDLVEFEGKLTTYVMEKTAEPNIFSVKEKFEGNVFDETVKRLKNEK